MEKIKKLTHCCPTCKRAHNHGLDPNQTSATLQRAQLIDEIFVKEGRDDGKRLCTKN